MTQLHPDSKLLNVLCLVRVSMSKKEVNSPNVWMYFLNSHVMAAEVEINVPSFNHQIHSLEHP